jgi:hypothetical protein
VAKCKLLAFLLCENATRDPDGKVTLHGLFDRMVIPSTSAKARLFFVFYKIVVEEACTVSLRVIDPANGEITGDWCDSIEQPGPVQSIWALTSTVFKHPGRYGLELRQESGESEARTLGSMLFVVEKGGE